MSGGEDKLSLSYLHNTLLRYTVKAGSIKMDKIDNGCLWVDSYKSIGLMMAILTRYIA